MDPTAAAKAIGEALASKAQAAGVTKVVFDRNTHKLVKYDLEGRLIYSWGTIGDFPGTLWGVHGMATDQEGNLYVAEVDSGRFQKFTPRPGANPAALAGKPIYSAWK